MHSSTPGVQGSLQACTQSAGMFVGSRLCATRTVVHVCNSLCARARVRVCLCAHNPKCASTAGVYACVQACLQGCKCVCVCGQERLCNKDSHAQQQFVFVRTRACVLLCAQPSVCKHTRCVCMCASMYAKVLVCAWAGVAVQRVCSLVCDTPVLKLTEWSTGRMEHNIQYINMFAVTSNKQSRLLPGDFGKMMDGTCKTDYVR